MNFFNGATGQCRLLRWKNKPLVLLLFFTLASSHQVFAEFVLLRTSCNSIRVEWQGVPFVGNIVIGSRQADCPAHGLRWIGAGTISRFSYRLQKKVDSPFDQWDNIGNPINTDATAQNYNNLSDGIYRVLIVATGAHNDDVWSYQNPCGLLLGKRYNFLGSANILTNNITIGRPTVGFFLADLNFNNIFCQDDIDSQGGIYMVTSVSGIDLTKAETHYAIDICKVDNSVEGGCLPWTSTYWQEGEVPDVVNLLTDVWQLHHQYEFWLGEYRVQLAIAQEGCVSWMSATETFFVVEAGSPCRQSAQEKEELNLSIFPNPSSGQINFKGLPPHVTAMPYRIIDISGRSVADGLLPS